MGPVSTVIRVDASVEPSSLSLSSSSLDGRSEARLISEGSSDRSATRIRARPISIWSNPNEPPRISSSSRSATRFSIRITSRAGPSQSVASIWMPSIRIRLDPSKRAPSTVTSPPVRLVNWLRIRAPSSGFRKKKARATRTETANRINPIRRPRLRRRGELAFERLATND